jgi:hypothetical protein
MWKRSERRSSTLAALLVTGLMVTAAPAGAADGADQGAASGAHADPPPKRVSPYVRYAREHSQSTERKPVRVKPSSFSVGHSPRVGTRARP